MNCILHELDWRSLPDDCGAAYDLSRISEIRPGRRFGGRRGLTAVAEKISALRSARMFASLKEPVSREGFEAALTQVPDADPDPWDVWAKSR